MAASSRTWRAREGEVHPSAKVRVFLRHAISRPTRCTQILGKSWEFQSFPLTDAPVADLRPGFLAFPAPRTSQILGSTVSHLASERRHRPSAPLLAPVGLRLRHPARELKQGVQRWGATCQVRPRAGPLRSFLPSKQQPSSFLGSRCPEQLALTSDLGLLQTGKQLRLRCCSSGAAPVICQPAGQPHR